MMYEFIKGQGWVPQVRKWTYQELKELKISMETTCLTCGHRYGSHQIGYREIITCGNDFFRF